MRLWSLHPKHLDRQGLTACWRESLLAQAVLAGRTSGYRSHPQLDRFRATVSPLVAIATYLHVIADEADSRGYRYDRARIDGPPDANTSLTVTTGQLDFEWSWLRSKLEARSPDWLARWNNIDQPETHPMFTVVAGPVESWERGNQ